MAAIRVLLKGNEVERRELGDSVVIGRGGECDLQLTGGDVSRTHCRIERAEGKYLLIDLGSRNGTLVDGVRAARHQLGDGDVLQVGEYMLQFVSSDATRQKLDEKVKELLKTHQEQSPRSLAAIIAEASENAAAKSASRQVEPSGLLGKLLSRRSSETTPTRPGDESGPWYRRPVPLPVAIAATAIVAAVLYLVVRGFPGSGPRFDPNKPLHHAKHSRSAD